VASDISDESGSADPGGPSAKAVFRRSGLTCLALLVLYFAVPIHSPSDKAALFLQIGLSIAAFIALLIGIKTQLLRQLGSPNAPLGGLVVGIVGGWLLFAMIDYAVAIYAPGSFDGLETKIDAVYFALATLLTVGFGDVSAHGQFARGLLCVQMVFNVGVLATTGSLVSGQIRERARARHSRS
jgi:voltage-gated potassium channel